MRMTNVRLTKRWSDWGPGEVVRLPTARAKRVIAKGYGAADHSRDAARLADTEVRGGPPIRHVEVETATALPAAERAIATPTPQSKPESPDVLTKNDDGEPSVSEATTDAADDSSPPRRGRPRKAVTGDGD